MGACEGVLDYDCEGGQKFTGPGTRRWSCWVKEDQKAKLVDKIKTANESERIGAEITEEGFIPTAAVTGGAISSSIMGAFTAGITGS